MAHSLACRFNPLAACFFCLRAALGARCELRVECFALSGVVRQRVRGGGTVLDVDNVKACVAQLGLNATCLRVRQIDAHEFLCTTQHPRYQWKRLPNRVRVGA